MAETTTTEEKKEKVGAYSGRLYTATVTAEGAGAVCEEEEKVDITEAGIRLTFMRIGLIDRTENYTPNNLEGVEEEHFIEYHSDELPQISLSNHKYTLTSLRIGYLYIINEADPEGWSEWEVLESHTLIKIDKEQAENDVRTTNSKSEKLTQYIAKPTDKLRIAYSDFQWSVAYFNKMKTDQTARAERMQLFDANQHISNTAQTNVFGPVQAQKSISFITEKVLDRDTTQKFFNIAGTDSERNVANYDIDMVIGIHDPIGIAIAITSSLSHYWLELNALLISLKIGQNTAEVESHLRKGINPESLENNPSKLSEAKALFNLASTWKSVALMNEKNKEDLVEAWGGLNMERIDKVLGKEQRDYCKNKIDSARKALTSYLKSNYYKKCETEHLEFIGESLTDAKQLHLLFLKQLAPETHNLDSFLLTKEELNKWKSSTTNKEVIAFIKNVIRGTETIGKIIEKKNVLEQLEDKSNLLKVIGITNDLLEVFKDLNENGEDILDDLNRVINSNIIKNFNKGARNEFITSVSDISKQYNKTKFSKLTDWIINFNEDTRKAIRKTLKKNLKSSHKFMKTRLLVFNDGFQKAAESELASGATKLQGHPRWSRMLRNLSFVNFGLALRGASKGENAFEDYLNSAKIIQSMGSMVVAQNNYKKINTKAIIKKVNKRLGTKIKKNLVREVSEKFSNRVGYLGAIIDATESAYNFHQRDYDASIAYGTAAITGAVSIYLLGAGVANVWNPLGWVCLLTATGMGFYAAYLEDSPLETLAKNGVFGKGADSQLEQSNDKADPIVLIQRHLSWSENTGSKNLNNEYKALMNIIVSGRITVNSNTALEYKADIRKNKEAVEFSKIFDVTQIKVEFDFGGFLVNEEDIQIKVFYYPGGREYGEEAPKQMSSLQQQAQIYSLELVKRKNENTKAICVFNVPDKWRNIDMNGLPLKNNADVMFMAYLAVSGGKGQYVPIKEDNNGEPTYLAAIHALQITRATVSKERCDYKHKRDRKNIKGRYKEITEGIGW